MVLEGTVKPPAGKFDGICKSITSSIDLIDQCAADNKLAKVRNVFPFQNKPQTSYHTI